MNILLVNSFKILCQGALREIINSTYITVESQSFYDNGFKNTTYFATFYTPSFLSSLLWERSTELKLIAKKLSIDLIQIVPIEQFDLNDGLEQAQTENTLETWKFYLELQYLF